MLAETNVTVGKTETNGGRTDANGEVTYTLTPNSIPNTSAGSSFRLRVRVGEEEWVETDLIHVNE